MAKLWGPSEKTSELREGIYLLFICSKKCIVGCDQYASIHIKLKKNFMKNTYV